MANVRMIIFSHLSDIQTGLLSQKEINNRVNFIKYLMMKHNLNADINPNEVWVEFTETKFYKPE